MATPTDAECCFGAQAILKRMDTAAKQAHAVRDSRDVEAVHDMRVASRRLRTALELFADCLPDRKARSWRKAIRRVTRALGEVRDTDVQIEQVRDFLGHIEDRRLSPGLQRLLLRLRQKRQGLQAAVIASLDRLDSSGVLAEMEDLLGPLLARGQLDRIDLNGPCVRSLAGQALAQRLERMLAYEPYVEQPDQAEQLHAMRIAAKHLRYAMEIFSPLYGEPFAERIKTVRQVQQQLGELHDADVWIAFLPAFVEQERQRTVEYFGQARTMGRLVHGIEALRAERRQYRDAVYRTFVESWKRLRQEDAWETLYATLRFARQAPPDPLAGYAGQEPSA